MPIIIFAQIVTLTPMKLKYILTTLCLAMIIPSFAKEYRTMERYTIATGNTELSRKDWLTSDRQDGTYQWEKSCLFNFSYFGGFKEYETIDQKIDFYKWLSTYLKEEKKENIAIEWLQAEIVMNTILREFEGNSEKNELAQFSKNLSKATFDSCFTRLQKLNHRKEDLVGEEAKAWDKEMFQFEHANFYQYFLDRLSPEALTDLNETLQRKNLAIFKIPYQLQFEGRVEDLELRLYWAMNQVVDYAYDRSISKKEWRKQQKAKKKEAQINAKTPKAKKPKKEKVAKEKKEKKLIDSKKEKVEAAPAKTEESN